METSDQYGPVSENVAVHRDPGPDGYREVTEVPITVKGADTFMPEGYLDGFKTTDSKSIEDGLIVRFYERS